MRVGRCPQPPLLAVAPAARPERLVAAHGRQVDVWQLGAALSRAEQVRPEPVRSRCLGAERQHVWQLGNALSCLGSRYTLTLRWQHRLCCHRRVWQPGCWFASHTLHELSALL